AIEESVAISLKTNRLMPFLKRLLHRFALRNDKASSHFGTKPNFMKEREMKKICALVICLFVILAVSPQNANGQYKSSWVYLNSGVVTDETFDFEPFFWTAGLNIDFYLSYNLTISPECYIIVHNLEFDAFILAPAVLLNLELQTLFLGGGVTKWFIVGTKVKGAPSSDWALKLNAGLKGGGIKLAAFVVTPFEDAFKYMAVGTTIGFGF
ncbi:MAG: hypothetical protein ACETWK_01140, partial [Candidatus Aminicenantaceae bacterium]